MDRPITVSRDSFFSNRSNKGKLTTKLMEFLTTKGIVSIQHRDDADTLIVSTAIDVCNLLGNTVVISDDTDVLVMLIHNSSRLKNELYMKSKNKYYPIKAIARRLTYNQVSNLLSTHAFFGSDTTSFIYRVSKTKGFQLTSSEIPQRLLGVFQKVSSVEEIEEASVEIFRHIYGYNDSLSLGEMRSKKYHLRCSQGTLQP